MVFYKLLQVDLFIQLTPLNCHQFLQINLIAKCKWSSNGVASMIDIDRLDIGLCVYIFNWTEHCSVESFVFVWQLMVKQYICVEL